MILNVKKMLIDVKVINTLNIFLLSLFILFSLQCFSQNEGKGVIQFSGVVITDNLKPVPFTSIMIQKTNRGTISDYYGFFSIVAQEGDVILFSAVGFKQGKYVIPKNLETSHYSLIQILHGDTVRLKETVIYPWPTTEQFKQAFLNLKIPDDDLERAKKNLALEEMKTKMDVYERDGMMNYNNYIYEQSSKLYYAGQYPPNNLLNPLSWAKFIEAWRNGELKIKNE
ncbi:MAG: carboxypeptidase-like regulatory domain-containing protein [Bacteroidota bacterium]|nr:carboxypeptidase-like regulatory domain-containing protein [Bacteroidota bacterium]